MKKLISWMGLGLMLTGSGCAVVSANRVFPKVTWYWSADAKAQRESDRVLNDPSRTNDLVWPTMSVETNSIIH